LIKEPIQKIAFTIYSFNKGSVYELASGKEKETYFSDTP
jgi:hypothetical protein